MTTSSYESLSHAKWDCKYHVVFIPKGRKKALYGKIRKFLGPVLRELAGQRGSIIVEGHMVQDHVHMLIRIPPTYAVAAVLGYIKSKSAIAVARQFGGRQRNFHGERFWARGYAVSTVGFEEEQIRASSKHQEQLDAQGSDEPGEFSLRNNEPWQPLGLLTTVKPPALRGRYDSRGPWSILRVNQQLGRVALAAACGHRYLHPVDDTRGRVLLRAPYGPNQSGARWAHCRV